MIDFLHIDFLARAMIAGVVSGAVAPVIGAFATQKRLALIGDGVGHVAFAGVAVALWLGTPPLGTAIAFAVFGALGIDRLRRRSPDEADIALAYFFYLSIAVAVVVASRAGNLNVGILAVLFGQVLTVTNAELVTVAMLALLVLVAVVGLYRGLVAVVIDEEAAEVSGAPVGALNVVLMVLIAATIGIGMRVVGILLVAALMVLPVATARRIFTSFRATILAASAIGALSSAGGIVISYYLDTAPSGTIVLVAAATLGVSPLVRKVVVRADRLKAPASPGLSE